MSERAERAILDAAEAYRLVEEVNLLRARAETAEALLAAVTAELAEAQEANKRSVLAAVKTLRQLGELREFFDQHEAHVREHDSLREQLAAGAERERLAIERERIAEDRWTQEREDRGVVETELAKLHEHLTEFHGCNSWRFASPTAVTEGEATP